MAPGRNRLLLAVGVLGLTAGLAGAAEPTREQRLAALPEADRAWVGLVQPILSIEEEKVFLGLADAAQREGFKEDFWQRREKPDFAAPLGPGYRDRYPAMRRLVDEKYDGWKSDAGRMVLRRGEPDSIFRPRCGEDVFRDVEIWTYGSLSLAGHSAARHILYRPAPGAPRRLWIVHDGYAAPFTGNPCRPSFDKLSRDCSPAPGDRCTACGDRCTVYQAWAEILKRQGSPTVALAEQEELIGNPKISTDGLNRSRAKWAAVAPVRPASIAAPLAPLAPAAALTRQPTFAPPPPTATPTPAPTRPAPTTVPTRPSPLPTRPPTAAPTPVPTRRPPPTTTAAPTSAPAIAPAAAPTQPPTPLPTAVPTRPPTVAPTLAPTRPPTLSPTAPPTRPPTLAPTAAPERQPSATPPPTLPATPTPTPVRTLAPAPRPTAAASPSPTAKPTAAKAAAVKSPTPSSGALRRLTPDEIRERSEALEPEYKEFLELAKPLLSEDELSRFLQLSGHDKDAFIREFWKRHS